MRLKQQINIVLITTALLLTACGYEYAAAPIQAWVIDAETKQPIEGVIVVALWRLKGGRGGGDTVGFAHILETVTDQNGRFAFPSWGPKTFLRGHLEYEDPAILLFKPGYQYRPLFNAFDFSNRYNKPSRRTSRWDGKKITFKRFRGSLKEYYDKYVSLLNNSLYEIANSDKCEWKKIPRMILALSQVKKQLRKNGIIRSLYSPSYLPTDEEKCGSPKVFFENYRQ